MEAIRLQVKLLVCRRVVIEIEKLDMLQPANKCGMMHESHGSLESIGRCNASFHPSSISSTQVPSEEEKGTCMSEIRLNID